MRLTSLPLRAVAAPLRRTDAMTGPQCGVMAGAE